MATGCGSDDILDSLLRAYARPGATLAYPDPTFSMIPIFARANGLRPRPVAPRPDLRADLGALLSSVCRPDNPTGALPDSDEIVALGERVSGLVVVDEAYLEFSGQPSLATRAAASSCLPACRAPLA